MTANRMATVPIPPSTPKPPATPQPVLPAHSNLRIPTKTRYLISSHTSKILDVVDKMSLAGKNPNILVEGKHGTGKSELASQYAASRNKPYAVLEVGHLSDPGQIYGYLDLKDGKTEYIKGIFTQAITTPNAVIHLQEINRPENDKALNALFSVLDDTQRSIWIDELQDYINVAPGVVFFASMNEGFEFVGTLPLDEALRSRFHFKIQLENLPEMQELSLLQAKCGLSYGEATVLIAGITPLRTNTQNALFISTRDLVNIANLTSYGLSLELSIKSVLGGHDDVMESLRLNEHVAGKQIQREALTYDYISK